jgi:YD repeat-containing protein
VATYFNYDDHNNLTEVSQGAPVVLGGGTEVAPGGSQPPPAGAVTKYSYDAFGYLVSSTSPTGVTTSNNYDENGNQTGTSFTWTDPNNAANTQTVTTSTGFNANDQGTSAVDEYNHTSQTIFDAKGRVTKTIDVLNNGTTTIYDAPGLPTRGRDLQHLFYP